MKYTKRIYIERATSERVSVSGWFADLPLLFCAQCAVQSEFVALDQAVRAYSRSAREIVRRVEAGEVHFTENSTGHLFVCRESLIKEAIDQE